MRPLTRSAGCASAKRVADGEGKVMNLNVKSVFLLTRSLVPLLEAKASLESPSRVINIGSIDG